ncbi:hypothetical protein VP1G_09700 [Cytospora mali]|uniref:HhH-GPD domain-containing protein n=1 Tax=Cytospora mali TaxID=578113 RepID=A0A194VFB3_CYTMA|nr:hypothetical protein VP1G_09700 [Valsa mali var. pyri (nom. inval.)]
MPAKAKAKAKSQTSKAPRVPVTGGWNSAHGMGLGSENPDRNIVQSRLRPRITKNVAKATEAKAQVETTEAKQDGVTDENDKVEIRLNMKDVKSEEDTSEPLNKERRTTKTSQSVDMQMGVIPEATEDIQIKTQVTTDVVVEDGPRGTKRKKTTRVVMAVAGRSAYESYVKIGWRTTPYPDFPGPTSEACEKVCALLEEQHGQCPRPKDTPPPSLDVAGCGQVRQVIDAIVRTVISANTTFENADKAIKRLHESFGTVTNNLQLGADDYPGLHHCLDYNKIRLASAKQVADAVEPSGSQFKKAGWIKALLDGTYKINAERAEAFRSETPDNPATVLAADKLSDKQKQFEIWMFDNGILHLEHYRALPNEKAMSELVSWNGVAVKTAACVLLFCMQQPVFALDTHCLRLGSWLGWFPHDASPEEAFAHLDTLVPDDLKYPLHQLFIRHGQVCLRCKKESNEGSAGWDGCVCPLEDLLKRTGKEKTSPKLKTVKSEMAHDEEEKDMEFKLATPKKRGRKPKKVDDDDDSGGDDDDYYEKAPKKQAGAARPKEKITEEVTSRYQTRSQKLINEGTTQEGVELKPADIDVTEAMLNPKKQAVMVAKLKG